MAKVSLKTHLIESIVPVGTPKTTLRWTVFTGVATQESSAQVPALNNSTEALGLATTGTPWDARKLKPAINVLQDVAP